MTGYEYERAVASYLSNNGYSIIEVTPPSGDYGVDIVAKKKGIKYAVQCKYYVSPVGQSAIREVVAGKTMYGCNGAMVVTNNKFTESARKLAYANGVILYEGVKGISYAGTPRGTRTIFRVVYLLFALGIIGWLSEEPLANLTNGDTVAFLLFLLMISIPFWYRRVFRLIKKGILLLLSRKASAKESSVEKIPSPNPSKSPPSDPSKSDTDRIKAVFYNNGVVLSVDELKSISAIETITERKIMRICKIDEIKAATIIDYLFAGGLIAKESPQTYIWKDNKRM